MKVVQMMHPQMRMFHATASTYDDWLHRGFFLQDMDFHCYVAHVEVVSRSNGQLGQCFVFDEHYIKSKTYWQRLAQRIAVTRVIGATCPRIDVDEGEENARYKLALFGLTRCHGRGACADPGGSIWFILGTRRRWAGAVSHSLEGTPSTTGSGSTEG